MITLLRQGCGGQAHLRQGYGGQARRTAAAIAVLGVTLAAASSASAHHSFAMFDTAKRVSLTGTVTAFEWTNPHVYIEMDVPDDKGGAVKHWSVELGSPSILQQGGWKFSDVKVGDKVTAVINPLRNGDAGGLLFQVTLRDGRVLGNGPGRGGA
ncbi:MAG TPA: DUF6152 family protein [Vicinamibacterales bacterium]